MASTIGLVLCKIKGIQKCIWYNPYVQKTHSLAWGIKIPSNPVQYDALWINAKIITKQKDLVPFLGGQGKFHQEDSCQYMAKTTTIL